MPGTEMDLTADQAQELLAVLNTHEADLRRKAEAEEQRVRQAISEAQTYLYGLARAKEAEQIDIASRPFPWTYDAATWTWTCDVPPNRGTVHLAVSNLVWEGCLERPHMPKHESPFFSRLEEALAWVEQELTAAAAQPPKEPPTPATWLSLATLTPEHRERLAPYWIEPSVLEPTRLTYRAVIYLEHVPIDRKYWEFSFGEKVYYDETYPTAAQLARKLGLDRDRVEVQPIVDGPLYRITSLATYAQATSATTQAERIWDGSAIASVFRAREITGATYGIEEVETMYRTWIGGYGEWPEQPQDRDQWKAEKAFDLTLIHALDIAGYRASIPLPSAYDSDEVLLVHLHERRRQSVYLSLAVRAESDQWLQEHTGRKTS